MDLFGTYFPEISITCEVLWMRAIDKVSAQKSLQALSYTKKKCIIRDEKISN